MRTFYHWLRYQREREDTVGDFARDVFWDCQAPRTSNERTDWKRFIEIRRLPRLYNGFKQAWQEYVERKKEDVTD